MPVYLRNYEGDCFFFTVVTHKRRNLFNRASYRKMLSEAIRITQKEYPWEMTAIVLMPNHLHMMWTLPPEDRNYSRRISLIKRRFTEKYLQSDGRESNVSESQHKERYRGVWQRKFWEHTIKDAADFKMHLDYIHINPVKHNLTEKPIDWQWSSFHKYVQREWYEPDWIGRVDLPGNIEYYFE